MAEIGKDINYQNRSIRIDSWAEFKKWIDGTYHNLSYVFYSNTSAYRILTEEHGGWIMQYDLAFDDVSDKSDFDANFKNLNARMVGSSSISNVGDGYGNALTVGQSEMSGSLPVVISSNQTSVPATLKSADGTSIYYKDGYYTGINPNVGIVAGTDSNLIARKLLTTTDGRLSISAAISAPTNTTPVRVSYSGNISGTDYQFYVVPTGKELSIQLFQAGAETDSTAGNKCEIFFSESGNTGNMTLIGVPIYVSGSTYELSLDYKSPIGNGTRSIVVKRTRFSGGSKEISAAWNGYY